MSIPFIKMHGAGNDFVVLDNRKGELPPLDWRALADRHFGIGCDQVVVLETPKDSGFRIQDSGKNNSASPNPESRSPTPDIFMRLYNADGGEVGSCGNASRCVAWLVHCELGKSSVTIETIEALITAEVTDRERVTVDMGKPRLDWQEIPLAEERDTLHFAVNGVQDAAAVNIGNPHMIFFVPDARAAPLAELGPLLERHELFPQRANISAAQIDSKNSITLRVWERGAGLTQACGTAACATLVAAHLRGLTGRKAAVHLPGGTLHIEWRDDDHVMMTGPAAISFKGVYDY